MTMTTVTDKQSVVLSLPGNCPATFFKLVAGSWVMVYYHPGRYDHAVVTPSQGTFTGSGTSP